MMGPTAAGWEIRDSDGTSVLRSGTLNNQVSGTDLVADGVSYQKMGNVTPAGAALTFKFLGGGGGANIQVMDVVKFVPNPPVATGGGLTDPTPLVRVIPGPGSASDLPIELGAGQPGGSYSVVNPRLNGHWSELYKGDYYGTWRRRAEGLPVHPLSDTLLGPLRAAGGVVVMDFTASPKAGGASYTGGFNTFPGDDSDSWSFDAAHQHWGYGGTPGVKKLKKPPMYQEGSTSDGFPCPNINDGGDHHILGVERDEATGGVKAIYEGYQLNTFDGVDIYGQGMYDNDFTVVDPPPPNGYPGTDAAGLPLIHGTLMSEQLGLGFGHVLRFTIAQGYGHKYYCHPARDGNFGWAPWPSGLPLGAIVRLKQSWYDAHKGDYTGQARVLVDWMREYGLILADWSYGPGMRVSGLGDDGFVQADLNQFGTHPITADEFEVLDFPHYVRTTGPTSVALGAPVALTLTHEPATDLNWGIHLYPQTITHTDGTTSQADWPDVSLGAGASLSGSTFSCTQTFHPPKAGAWTLNVTGGNGEIWYRDPFTFTVSGPATTYEITSPGGTAGAPLAVAVGPNGTYTGTITITPSGCGLTA
jgi:hypothetical protein